MNRTIDDPLEPMNRGIFAFNEVVDKAVLEPVARGYDSAAPDQVKRSVHNFFGNLATPKKFVSAAMQLKARDASVHVGRFIINSTLGVVGLFDVASYYDVTAEGDDFGVALGSYGIGPGPYLVLPILGPSSFRDFVGTIVDGFLDPVSYITGDSAAWVQGGARATKAIEQRRRLIDAIDVGRKSSLDYYTFVQSSFQQSQLNQIYDGDLPEHLREPGENTEEDEGWTVVPEEQE